MTSLLPEPRPASSSAVRVEGRLFTSDLLARLAAGDRELPGCAPTDYGLHRGERIGDAAGRAWAALTGAYQAFRADLACLPKGAGDTALTRKAWLLRIFSELGYGPLNAKGVTVSALGRDERLRVSHRWQDHFPIQLLGWGTSLDDRSGGKRPPQSVLQELLNVSAGHLWGVLSNGRRLRVLRDSTSLVGSAYLEFDLETIFDNEQYADFVLLYSLLHASRFELVARPRKRRVRRAGSTAETDVEAEPSALEEQDEGDAPGQPVLDEADDPDAVTLTPADCRIEWLRAHSLETGLRARDRLRDQVADALGVLGTGFLDANPEVRDRVARGGQEALEEFHHELLRLAYQLIFVFVAEDRGILLDPTDSPEVEAARGRYKRYFSTRRLRRIAFRRPGDRNTDLWPALCRVLNALGTDGGEPALALPELGGLFFRGGGDSVATTRLGSAEPLREAKLANDKLLEAIRLLCRIQDASRRWQRVDYQHLGADELGSVYESLLELRPRRTTGPERFWLQTLAGNKRKTTGAYYTPVEVIEKLLDEVLDRVIRRYETAGDPRGLLKARFVDPACGSGHVLVAAARRIARRYAELESGDPEPAPEKVRGALAEVVRHCVHGVDINPVAVEIAKVSLWLESLEPGRPLAYLDDRIKVGNALLGATPNLIASGLPDGAFRKLTGDNSEILAKLKAANKKERADGQGTQSAIGASISRVGTSRLRREAEDLAGLPDGTLAEVREQARRHEAFVKESEERRRLKRVADAWCAAFLWPKHEGAPPAITSTVLQQLSDGARLPGPTLSSNADGAQAETPEQRSEREGLGERTLRNIVSRNLFFHWHLEFPRIFRVEDETADDHNPDAGWQGGFDCVLGNPPWERVKVQEKEWFASRDETITDAENAHERKKHIAALKTSDDPVDRELHELFQIALREAAGTTLMLRHSGIFPLTGQGDVNTYAVFAERARMLLAPEGISSLVLPTGIATDKTTSRFFSDLVERKQLMTVLDMENEEKLFADVHNQYRFCLFTISGPALRSEKARLAFRARRPDQLEDRVFELDAEGFRAINPNTRNSPVCESPKHLAVLRGIHERVPVLWRKENPRSEQNLWNLHFMRMFDMASDSKNFLTEKKLVEDGWHRDGTVFTNSGKRALPLYEGKFVHLYDSRFATYEGATQAQVNKGTLPQLDVEAHEDPYAVPLPRYWVLENQVDDRLAGESLKPDTAWAYDWLMGWRDVCRASDERTVIASVVPRTAVGHKFPLLRAKHHPELLLANLSSRVLDFAARQKYAGASLTYFVVEQLPVLGPETYTYPTSWLAGDSPSDWIRDRVLELAYTSHDLAPFARHLGDEGSPFVWNEERRFLIRAELDAAYFHLYGLSEEEAVLVLNSFRAFRNRKPALFQRTKEEVLAIYRQMQRAAAEGARYVDPRLSPPPAHGRRHALGKSPLIGQGSRASKWSGPVGSGVARQHDAEEGLFGLSDLGIDEQLHF